MNSHELLIEIARANPTLTHFLLRLYKQTLNPFVSRKGDFSYRWIEVDDIGDIQNRIAGYENEGFMVGLTSMVMTEREVRSLLLLDFSVPQSDGAEREIIEKISTFNHSGDASYRMNGWLIKTNVSYHYLGKHITSPEDFRHFLGASLLFRHGDQKYFVVDDRWLGHQLKRGYGSIRIGRKDGNFPTVIGEIV